MKRDEIVRIADALNIKFNRPTSKIGVPEMERAIMSYDTKHLPHPDEINVSSYRESRNKECIIRAFSRFSPKKLLRSNILSGQDIMLPYVERGYYGGNDMLIPMWNRKLGDNIGVLYSLAHVDAIQGEAHPDVLFTAQVFDKNGIQIGWFSPEAPLNMEESKLELIEYMETL